MKRTQFKKLFIGLALSIGLFPSCGNKPSDNAYKQQARYFAADESLSPVIDEELDIFNMKNKRDSIYPLYINEQEAIEKLLNRELLLVFTTRTLTPNEELIIKEQQYNPRCIPLAYDALALIVNKANPDSLITTDNFRRIMAGEITTWKELNPNSKLGKIKVAFDNPKSGTLRFVADSVMQGKEIKTDGNVKAAMKEIVTDFIRYHVHDNSVAIGMAHDPSNEGKYESMKRDLETGRFYPLNVNFTKTAMTVKDVFGNTYHVKTDNPKLYNQICREYWFEGTGDNSRLFMASDAVVHQIDGVLCTGYTYPANYEKDPSKAGKTVKMRPWREIVEEALNK